MTLGVDLDDGQGRGLGTDARHRQVGAVGGEQVSELLTEGIGGEAPKELGRGPQAGERSGCSEGAAAG
jgi:hypothetical protein